MHSLTAAVNLSGENLAEHDSLRWEVSGSLQTSMNRLAGPCVVLENKMLEVILVNGEHHSALPGGIDRMTSSFSSTSSERSAKDFTVGGPANWSCKLA